jgi:chemotaxis protein CheC
VLRMSKANRTAKISDWDILRELGGIGAGHASKALSLVLHEEISVEVPALHAMSPHLVPGVYGEHETPVAAVFAQLRGEADCDIMLIFEAEEARKIAALMTYGTAGCVDEELENSAIEELGSIMIGSFFSAIGNFSGLELVPSPPQLAIDAFDAVLDGMLVSQALRNNVAAVFDARFKRKIGSAKGYLILMPGENLLALLAAKGKKWLENSRSKRKTALLCAK